MLAKCTSAGCATPRKELWSSSVKSEPWRSSTAGGEAPQSNKLPADTSPTSSDTEQSEQVRRARSAQLEGREEHREQTKSTLTLWLNMSVSCRSCVYWHRCCRIISTLSTSSLSSSWTWRKTSPYFYWNLSLEAQRKDDTQKAARRCPRVMLWSWALWLHIPLLCKE